MKQAGKITKEGVCCLETVVGKLLISRKMLLQHTKKIYWVENVKSQPQQMPS